MRAFSFAKNAVLTHRYESAFQQYCSFVKLLAFVSFVDFHLCPLLFVFLHSNGQHVKSGMDYYH